MWPPLPSINIPDSYSSSLPRRVWWPSLYDEVKDTFSRSPSLLVDHRRCLRIGKHFNISSKANRHPEQTVVTAQWFTLSAIQFWVINDIWKMFGKIYFGIGVIFWKDDWISILGGDTSESNVKTRTGNYFASWSAMMDLFWSDHDRLWLKQWPPASYAYNIPLVL